MRSAIFDRPAQLVEIQGVSVYMFCDLAACSLSQKLGKTSKKIACLFTVQTYMNFNLSVQRLPLITPLMHPQ